MTGQHWNTFGHCPTCGAQPGRPCRDLRRRRRRLPGDPQSPAPKYAHRDREQLAEPLPVETTGEAQ